MFSAFSQSKIKINANEWRIMWKVAKGRKVFCSLGILQIIYKAEEAEGWWFQKYIQYKFYHLYQMVPPKHQSETRFLYRQSRDSGVEYTWEGSHINILPKECLAFFAIFTIHLRYLCKSSFGTQHRLIWSSTPEHNRIHTCV